MLMDKTLMTIMGVMTLGAVLKLVGILHSSLWLIITSPIIAIWVLTFAFVLGLGTYGATYRIITFCLPRQNVVSGN